jgi:hypothetical protein
MIIDKSSSEPIDLKTKLYQLVAESKMSSLDMISDMVGTDEEMVRAVLEELLEDGSLNGSFTEDGHRFFLSEVSISTAPKAAMQDKGYEVARADTRNGRMVLFTGLAMMIGGYITLNLTSIHAMMEHLGGAIVMIGLVVLIIGWLMISRADPPSNIK